MGKRINKVLGTEETVETEQGIVSEKFPELKLDMDNAELLALTKKWNKTWTESAVYGEWVPKGNENENYWLGKHFQSPKVDKTRALVDNVLFEALETYLPQVTQHNPEAVVSLGSKVGQTPENLAFATNLKNLLGDYADEECLRLKLKDCARHWSIYMLGVAKMGWDLDENTPSVQIIRPQRLILDYKATVTPDGYTGMFIGEHRDMEAGLMIAHLDAIGGEGDYAKFITGLVNNELGTEIGFIEWWTNEYMCWTLNDTVLLKKKNPHWNYDKNVPAPADAITGQTPVGPDGQPQTIQKLGFNHLAKATMPYRLLSIYNLGKQPVDITSLLGQNLSSQDLINKRIKQIDKNADSMNGSMVVSMERSGLTMQEAKGVTEAIRKGGTIVIPSGSVQDAVARMTAPGLPNDVYNQLQDTRSRIQYIFGTKGFTPSSGGSSGSAVRMQLINQSLDQARIAGGFSEYLEQFADDIYNFWVQMLYVYDEDFAGKEHPKVRVSIKEGSLLPKDSASVASQAIQLANANRMSLFDLYTKLEYPNPMEMAANVWLETNAPDIMFEGDPRVQKAIQAKQQAASGTPDKTPSESINFKDLPPDGQAQMASKAGITLHPEGIAAHQELKTARENAPSPISNQPIIPGGIPQ